MKNARQYVGALEYQKQIFQLIEDFIISFNTDGVAGYLSLDNKSGNSLDFSIGSDKFTILANIQQGGKIVFNVFLWEFDLSSLTRYTGKNVEQLILIKDGQSLVFKNVQYGYDNHDFTHLLNLSQEYTKKDVERFFDQVEIYLNNKNNPQEMKAY